MADLMTALRNAHNAGDTEAASRIAQMIKAQQAPQGATAAQQPQPNPTTQQQTNEPQSALDEAFNAVGNVAAGMGRQIAGGVAGIANVGVGALNTIGQGVQSLSNAVTGENEQYTPIAPAGYGAADQYLMPRGAAENLGSDIITYAAGGELLAPLKAAEGAGIIARTGTSLANNAAQSAAGSLSKYNSGQQSGDVLEDMATNALAGTVLEKVAAPVIRGARNLLPESLGGISQAEKAATVANPEYLNRVLQNGDTEAQQAFRTATTDEAGNSILNPSQVLNAERGGKYIAAEQRDLTRGANSTYAANLEAQQSGQGITQAINDLAPTNGNTLQGTTQDITAAFKQRSNELYNESKTGAQAILDNGPVKVTELKLPETKKVAQAHLDDSAATGNIKLTADTRRTLTQFNKAKIDNINTLDQWKRTLNEKAQKAYRAGDYTSYNALNEVSTGLKSEADNLLNAIDPKAGSLYRDADKFYSQSVGDFGNKSIIGKMASKDNPDLAGNVLLRGQNGEFNTNEVVTALNDAIARGDIPNAQALAQQLGQSLGDTSRATALERATTGDNFSNTKFVNEINRTSPQIESINPFSLRNESQVNNALADSVRAMRDRATVPTTNGLVAQAAGRISGGLAGSAVGGVPGAVIGQEIGGRVTTAINQGLLDRLAGTVKRGNEYVNYLNVPENAKQVAEILAARGANFDNASAQEVASIIKTLTRPVAGNGLNAIADSQNQTTSTPSAQAQPEPQTQEPEPAPQMPDKYEGAKRFYKSIISAETGGLENRFIRTKAAEAGPSTAYGPAQITVTLADSFRKKHADLFTKSERDYLDRFSEQGHNMLRADPNDPVFGYGGSGVLTSDEDKRLYDQVAVKMIEKIREDNNGSYDKTLREWRGADDAKYFAKVRNSMRELKKSSLTQSKPKNKGWSKQ